MATEFNYDRSARYYERNIQKTIDVLKSLLTKPSTAESVAEIRISLNELSNEFEKFKEISDRGFHSIDPKQTKEKIAKLEDALINNVDEGKERRESLLHSTLHTSITGSAENTVKLPKINVPKFDGNLEDFYEFSALFENVIHNEPTLTKVKKLYYLKESLIGKAANLVKDIPLTEAGYDEAWGLVQSTFKNTKAIIRKHLDRLFAIKRIKSATEIPNLLSTVNRCLKGIKACGEDSGNWSVILSYMISEKLNEATYVEFEKSLITNTRFPSWSALSTFLQNRSSIARSISETDKSTKPKPESAPKRSTALITMSGDSSNSKFKPKCVVCSRYHLLKDCDQFMPKSPKQRYELLKSKPICRNCFRTNHKTQDCSNAGNCRKCKAQHHTLLHFEFEPRTQPPSDSKHANANTPSRSSSNTTDSCLSSIQTPIVLLPSAVVNFQCGKVTGEIRVLLGSTSQVNLISKKFVDRFRLPARKSDVVHNLCGINDTNHMCDKIVRLKSKFQSFACEADFNMIATRIPYSVHGIHSDLLNVNLSSYRLADRAYYNQSKIDITGIDALLGIEEFDKIVTGSVVRIENVTLPDTKFGCRLPLNRINRDSILIISIIPFTVVCQSLI